MIRGKKKGVGVIKGIVFLLIVLSCYRKKLERPQNIGPVDIKARYTLGPEDIIEIKLYPDGIGISGIYTLDEDGRIVLPILGEVFAAGMTTTALRLFLEEEIGKYIIKPSVQVLLREAKSKKVYLVGPDKSGIIFMQRPMNVLDALMIGGGINPKSKQKAYIVRGSLQNPVVFEVDIERIIKYGDFKENIALEPGDIVIVPEKLINRIQDILGIYGSIGYNIYYGTTGLKILGIVK